MKRDEMEKRLARMERDRERLVVAIHRIDGAIALMKSLLKDGEGEGETMKANRETVRG
jgi:hypothetical protein